MIRPTNIPSFQILLDIIFGMDWDPYEEGD
jgi:hypothetical protein